ncbi:thioredoxin-like negative regulator of GroEL [Scopulibacillus daqui]|uniref:Thioredoxin-like negative regulator of GroEL n=1 Tax=Scopulibacillus daqui TaxID=1469162 RepID=A0ABS2Q3Z4_9BACL|nr:thioredoxin family protein [Scopulibacillus daqui]MBM7646414.1 thioredoxin-like negative regulator of GroEL [Scopulibacillus daqui]
MEYKSGFGDEMKEISESDFFAKNEQDAGLFFVSPFCGTCQLAEQMLNIAIEAAEPDFPVYKCRVSEWPETVAKLKVKSVPCLAIIKNNSKKLQVYAFESVTKLYHHLKW